MNKFIGNAIVWFFVICAVLCVGSCTVKCVAEAVK